MIERVYGFTGQQTLAVLNTVPPENSVQPRRSHISNESRLAARLGLVRICPCTRARETVRAQFQRHGRSIATLDKCPTWHINRVQQSMQVKIVLTAREAKGRPPLPHASF